MKKLLCILLAGLSVFTLTACNKTDSLQTEIDALKQSLAELQASVSSQSEQISTLQGEKAAQAGKIAELESAKAAQAETIAALQNSAHLSAEEIAALEAQLAEQETLIAEQERYLSELIPKGAFCSLQTAYANGWIDDLALFKIWKNFETKLTDQNAYSFVYNSSQLDAITLYAIKQTYLEYEKRSYPNSKRTVNHLSFGCFYGIYGKYIALHLFASEVENSPSGDMIFEDTKIGNYTFTKFNIGSIYIWYPVEG